MAAIGSGGVSLRGIPQPDFSFTFKLHASITAADIGKPVAMSTVANTVILATTGSKILGMLATYEDRTIEGFKAGAVETKGGFNFPILSTATGLAVGDSVIGGAGATVDEGTDARNVVVNITGNIGAGTGIATVLVM